MIPAPASIEIDALRRALDDRQLGRIGAHVTIVPPINLRDDVLPDAMVVVDRAATAVGPFTLTLGPLQTFEESSPVRFLGVVPWEPVSALYEACWTGPFDRDRTRPFHPHVTVDIDGSPTTGPDPAIDLLAGYAVDVVVDRLTLLEYVDDADGRRWEAHTHYPLVG
ncbi:2'-5' RNA ligase family protein [Actinospongicola halichondriae]|uniref:2'-5' RNA ligase family protein n=1 Tax=Actinospongicola halichondriae TaxID=3236844 RepID=UPI003D383D53